MGIWPFGKKKSDDDRKEEPGNSQQSQRQEPAADSTGSASAESSSFASVKGTATDADAASGQGSMEFAHDAVNGETGPFDGDSVNIDTFDFSDSSIGILDLGSIRIPLPKDSQVQVEMGEQGPKMLHIVTKAGRITPVAFAAPRKPGQWAESVEEIKEGMGRDGLSVTTEQGPWGVEIIGKNDNGQLRVIGAEGPRWMLRLTLAAPNGLEEDLTQIARDVASRTFVYRGEDPILAGNALSVIMPKQLVEQVKQAMETRQQEQTDAKSQGQSAQSHPENGVGGPDPTAVAEAERQLRDVGAQPRPRDNESLAHDQDKGSNPHTDNNPNTDK
ncbi:DUF3710 domain-containing protein [Corynebacterium macginleyi]|uniref:DUF3710 domain-containing protein n=1 Tax=Corynebacterium macginleyi TaxID=38290 RepID=UPI00190CE4FC|nr:DUF3710 domain-containing protein [Corynebacterium macginleyi]MBK4141885.1 DUF3710 domain-containing protein [Corynebacterium macginleyi]